MDNLEYLEKCKDNSKIDHFIYEHEIEFRKTRALEIIAETLINIKDKMDSEEGMNVNVIMG